MQGRGRDVAVVGRRGGRGASALLCGCGRCTCVCLRDRSVGRLIGVRWWIGGRRHGQEAQGQRFPRTIQADPSTTIDVPARAARRRKGAAAGQTAWPLLPASAPRLPPPSAGAGGRPLPLVSASGGACSCCCCSSPGRRRMLACCRCPCLMLEGCGFCFGPFLLAAAVCVMEWNRGNGREIRGIRWGAANGVERKKGPKNPRPSLMRAVASRASCVDPSLEWADGMPRRERPRLQRSIPNSGHAEFLTAQKINFSRPNGRLKDYFVTFPWHRFDWRAVG